MTKQEKKQAEAAIYGLEEKTTVSDQSYDPKDIEQMRQIVLQNDISTGKVTEFDLNKPTTETYVFQEFPRIIYNHKANSMKKVANEKEMEEALSKGWSKDPPAPKPAEGEEATEPQAEEESGEEQTEERHRGRRR